MTHRRQYVFGALIGVGIGLSLYTLSHVSEVGLAAAAATLGTAWWVAR